MKHLQPIIKPARRTLPKQAWTHLALGAAAFAAVAALALHLIS